MSWKACLLAIVCTAPPPGASAQTAPQCQPRTISRSAHFVVEGNARSAAIASWTVRATALHGPMWANWTNAANQQVTCRLSTMPTGLNGHLCTASARPCILP